ncbi:MAG: polysaccharide deacetylase family protein [Ardenticatenaceae bacterium]|nr:polysaccharide deacetylase family protein [Ardenticatenaceae bacterium]
MRKWGWGVIVVLLLVGCQQPAVELSLPTLMPVAALPAAPMATLPATMDLNMDVATAVPLASPPATSTPLTVITLAPDPELTPLPDLPSENRFTCRTEATLTAVSPIWIVRPGPWPRPAAAAGLLGHYPDTGLKLLHLGFDVEGDPYFVGDLLDVLDKRQVKTTMFVLGSWADTYPEWVQEFARRGHELATHGYSHADMSSMTASQISAELRDTEFSINSLTGQTTKPWLRPPFGSYSETSVQAAYAAGYTTVIWTGSANDWRSGMDADKMCATLRYYASPGAILYAHTNRAEVVTAVDRFIAEMQDAGYTFVPLSLLLADDPADWLQRVEVED